MRDGIDLPGLVAAANLSAKQYHVMAFASTAGQVKTATAGDTFIGVLQNDPASGEAAFVRSVGVSLVVAGTGAITAGAALLANSTGQVANTTTDNADIIGTALEASSASGDQILALLIGPNRY